MHFHALLACSNREEGTIISLAIALLHNLFFNHLANWFTYLISAHTLQPALAHCVFATLKPFFTRSSYAYLQPKSSRSNLLAVSRPHGPFLLQCLSPLRPPFLPIRPRHGLNSLRSDQSVVLLSLTSDQLIPLSAYALSTLPLSRLTTTPPRLRPRIVAYFINISTRSRSALPLTLPLSLA